MATSNKITHKVPFWGGAEVNAIFHSIPVDHTVITHTKRARRCVRAPRGDNLALAGGALVEGEAPASDAVGTKGMVAGQDRGGHLAGLCADRAGQQPLQHLVCRVLVECLPVAPSSSSEPKKVPSLILLRPSSVAQGPPSKLRKSLAHSSLAIPLLGLKTTDRAKSEAEPPHRRNEYPSPHHY